MTMALSNCRIVRPREDPPHPSRTPGKSPDARTYSQCPMRSTRRVRMRGKFLRRGNFHRTTGRNSGLSPLRVGNKRTRKTEIVVQPTRKRQVLVQNDPHKEHNENNTPLGKKHACKLCSRHNIEEQSPVSQTTIVEEKQISRTLSQGKPRALVTPKNAPAKTNPRLT